MKSREELLDELHDLVAQMEDEQVAALIERAKSVVE
jgi:hypothetical protein